VARRDASLLHRDRRERGRADHIAGGVDAGRAGAIAVIDVDASSPLDRDAYLVERQAFGVADPAGREQQLVGTDADMAWDVDHETLAIPLDLHAASLERDLPRQYR